jgi:hypothetical protein
VASCQMDSQVGRQGIAGVMHNCRHDCHGLGGSTHRQTPRNAHWVKHGTKGLQGVVCSYLHAVSPFSGAVSCCLNMPQHCTTTTKAAYACGAPAAAVTTTPAALTQKPVATAFSYCLEATTVVAHLPAVQHGKTCQHLWCTKLAASMQRRLRTLAHLLRSVCAQCRCRSCSPPA